MKITWNIKIKKLNKIIIIKFCFSLFNIKINKISCGMSRRMPHRQKFTPFVRI